MYCLADSTAELNSKSELTGSFKLSAFPLLKCDIGGENRPSGAKTQK